MKRIIAILIAVLMLSSVSAFADNFDFTGWSNEQIMDLYNAVRAEMTTRGLSPALSLRDGKYIVGKDIDAGTYKLTCTGTEGESLGDAYSSLGSAFSAFMGDEWTSLMNATGGLMGSVSEMKVEVLGDYGTVLQSISMKTGDVTTITLSEGTALSITEGSCTIEQK